MQVNIPGTGPFPKERTVWVEKRWAVVHAKSRTRINSYGPMYSDREKCREHCRAIIANNPKEIVAAHFPEGVDAAPFWCHENGHVHSNIENIPTFIQIKREKKGNFVWSIYTIGEKFKKMNNGDPDIELVKAEALELFPYAKLEINGVNAFIP